MKIYFLLTLRIYWGWLGMLILILILRWRLSPHHHGWERGEEGGAHIVQLWHVSLPLTFYWPSLVTWPPLTSSSCILEGERAEMLINSSLMSIVHTFNIRARTQETSLSWIQWGALRREFSLTFSRMHWSPEVGLSYFFSIVLSRGDCTPTPHSPLSSLHTVISHKNSVLVMQVQLQHMESLAIRLGHLSPTQCHL